MIKPKLKKYAKRLSRRPVNSQIANFLSQCKKNDRILNIGSGGEISKVIEACLSEKNISFVSSDIDPNRNPDIVDDIVNSTISSNSFDYIVCAEVLEHVEHPHKAANNLISILDDGGKIFISTPFIFPTHDAPYDFFRYTEFGLKKIFSGKGDIVFFKPKHSYTESLMLLLLRGLWLRDARITTFVILHFFWNIPLFLFSKLFLKSFGNNAICSGFIMIVKK